MRYLWYKSNKMKQTDASVTYMHIVIYIYIYIYIKERI